MNSGDFLIFIIVSIVFGKATAQTREICEAAGAIVYLGNKCECCDIGRPRQRIGDEVGDVDSFDDCRAICSGRTVANGFAADAVFSHYRFRTNQRRCNCYSSFSGLSFSTRRTVGYTSGTGTGFTKGVLGDPHIIKWDGKKFDFHGECDLVLFQAPNFDNGFGLDVHIRTTIQKFYSYIEEIAIKAGSSVANVNKEGIWIGGELLNAFPAQNGPFHITHKIVTEKGGRTVKTYEVSVNKEPALRLRIPESNFLFVAVVGGGMFDTNFAGAKGLMGEHGSSKTVGRDGWTEFDDMNEFGLEWQVRPSEEMLFMHSREPQLPKAVCKMPAQQINTKRILAENPDLQANAERACGHVDADLFQMCIDDVIATGDVSAAGGY